MRKLSYQFVSLTLFIILSACISEKASSPMATVPSSTPPLETTEHLALTQEFVKSLAQPTITKSGTSQIIANPTLSHLNISEIKNIGSEREFYKLEWSSDSKLLFSGLWVYDVEHGTAQELTLENPLRQTTQPNIISHLPPEAINEFLSPNGKLILYFILTTPTPTPLPEGIGESGYYKRQADLWLYDENGGEQKLGEIEFCGYSDPFWIDEQRVILPNNDYLTTCGDTHAWLVDLQNGSLHPLLLREKYQSPVRIYDLSPNGENLLFSILNKDENGDPIYSLHVLDVNTEEPRMLDFPNTAHGEQWLTNEMILVSYLKSIDAVHLTLGIYNLNTSELVELTPMFEDYCIRFPIVSPDIKWLAFATGQGIDACNILTDLWLIELNIKT